MSFWKLKKMTEESFLQLSLQGCRQKTGGQSALHTDDFQSCEHEKRTSCRELPGNMTVEAALVLPVFLFAAVNLLSLLLMFRTYSAEEAKLHQTGRQMALYAYGQESGDSEIRLMNVNRIKSPFGIAAFGGGYTANGCVMHKWNGYDLNGTAGERPEKEEELVYITRSGSAYHRERGCRYLNPAIQMVDRNDAENADTEDGGKYTPCLVCGGESGLVYITEGGNRYHSTVNCTGLKRTIESVTLTEAIEAGRHPCPSCG